MNLLLIFFIVVIILIVSILLFIFLKKNHNLLFSIPVHENQDIINNQIENILKYNPGAKIILHVNSKFEEFQESKTNYPNVYINSKRLLVAGLALVHVENFMFAKKLKLNFDYFILLASNEMFFRKGLIDHVKKYKNGVQLVPCDKDNDWHNFNKGLENDEKMVKIMKMLNLNNFYGGQIEGSFFTKKVFEKISKIYLETFGTEPSYFETEEIVFQTIFAGLNIKKYTIPITLQNYTQDINFTPEFINELLENKKFLNYSKIPGTLISPHFGLENHLIFSIKRVNRTMNPLRIYLTEKNQV